MLFLLLIGFRNKAAVEFTNEPFRLLGLYTYEYDSFIFFFSLSGELQ